MVSMKVLRALVLSAVAITSLLQLGTSTSQAQASAPTVRLKVVYVVYFRASPRHKWRVYRQTMNQKTAVSDAAALQARLLESQIRTIAYKR